jgi:hypothetical protein
MDATFKQLMTEYGAISNNLERNQQQLEAINAFESVKRLDVFKSLDELTVRIDGLAENTFKFSDKDILQAVFDELKSRCQAHIDKLKQAEESKRLEIQNYNPTA